MCPITLSILLTLYLVNKHKKRKAIKEAKLLDGPNQAPPPPAYSEKDPLIAKPGGALYEKV